MVLNDQDLPEGFVYLPAFISPEEEEQLVNLIKSLDWQEVKLYGQIAKRRVVHYGLDYTYENRQVSPTSPPPTFLHNLIQRAANLLQLPFEAVAEILISEYPVGAGI